MHSRYGLLQAAATVVILLIAIYLRVVGLDWDEGHLLHPDERFLIMVQGATSWPNSISHFFDTATSPFNPHNRDFGFYVYGTLPLFLVKGLGIPLQAWDVPSHLWGRVLSVMLSLGTVVVIAATGLLLFNRVVALFGLWFLATCAFEIQQAHFGTVDVAVTFFLNVALLFAAMIVRYPSRYGPVGLAILSAAFGFTSGMALASKINAGLICLLLPIALGLHGNLFECVSARSWKEYFRGWTIALAYCAVGAFATLLAFRIFQPYAFTGPGFFDLALNEKWIKNIQEVARLSQPSLYFPPAVQWIDRSIFFSLWNTVTWGMGFPVGMFVLYSLFCAGRAVMDRDRRRQLLLPFLWATLGLVVFGMIPANPSQRYVLPIYGPLFLIAGWQASEILSRGWRGSRLHRGLYAATILAVVWSALWGWGFSRIYARPHSRVAASDWILEHIPAGITLNGTTSGGPIAIPVSISDDATITGRPLTIPISVQERLVLQNIVLFKVRNEREGALPNDLSPQFGERHTIHAQMESQSEDCLESTSQAEAGAESQYVTFAIRCILVPHTSYYLSLSSAADAPPLHIAKPVIAAETQWDDGLPIRRKGYDPFGGLYTGETNLDLYVSEPATKAKKLATDLTKADYLFISSNRQFGTVGRLPADFPVAQKLYRGIASCRTNDSVPDCYNRLEAPGALGPLGYQLIQTFTSYPSVLGIELNDQFAEEAYSVYDHPKVLLFAKVTQVPIKVMEEALAP